MQDHAAQTFLKLNTTFTNSFKFLILLLCLQGYLPVPEQAAVGSGERGRPLMEEVLLPPGESGHGQVLQHLQRFLEKEKRRDGERLEDTHCC